MATVELRSLEQKLLQEEKGDKPHNHFLVLPISTIFATGSNLDQVFSCFLQIFVLLTQTDHWFLVAEDERMAEGA
jgi:hypothetical protein